jgi:hypothetical protein
MTDRVHLRARDLDDEVCQALVSALKVPIDRYYDTHSVSESAVVKVPLWWEGIITRGMHASMRVEQSRDNGDIDQFVIIGHDIEFADVERPVVVGGDGE